MTMTVRPLLVLALVFVTVFSAEVSLTSTLKNTLAKLAESEDEEQRPTHCFSCTSIDASEIVGGAGVHPGVYLTSILLSTIPVTKRCHDPFFTSEAKQVGVAMPMCEDGLCVKINYTDKYSVNAQRLEPIRCYSCTTMDADRLLNDVQDANWRRWLENVRFVPKTDQCNDMFLPEVALRSGVRSQECEDGVCMKMWFKEKNGNSQVWRSCIPNAVDQIRSDCTRISSSEGDMEVCTCDGNLCNGVGRRAVGLVTVVVAVLFSVLLAKH